MRIVKGGSDFCYFCVSLRNDIERIPEHDSRHNAMIDIYKNHRCEAQGKFKRYLWFCKNWVSFPLDEKGIKQRKVVLILWSVAIPRTSAMPRLAWLRKAYVEIMYRLPLT